jgi:RNA polymerase sigma-70 factor (ECF subfamily)
MPESKSISNVVRLLMEHRTTLFAYIYTAVCDFDIAEEVFQEVSVAVCESHASFEPGTNFCAWAREIARRRILAQWRSAERSPDLLSDEALQRIETGFADVETRWAAHDRVAALRKCLGKLSPTMWRMVELRYVNQLSLSDLAARLERNSEGVRKALYRTRQLLRECIERRLRAEERA